MAGMALTNAERQRLSRERRAAGEQTVTVKLGDGTTVGVRIDEVKVLGKDRAGAWVATRSGAVHRISEMEFDELSDLGYVYSDKAEADSRMARRWLLTSCCGVVDAQIGDGRARASGWSGPRRRTGTSTKRGSTSGTTPSAMQSTAGHSQPPLCASLMSRRKRAAPSADSHRQLPAKLEQRHGRLLSGTVHS